MLTAAALSGCGLRSIISPCTRPVAGDSSIIFRDNFSNGSCGWDRLANDMVVTDYADGVYRIYINDVNSYYWANPGRSFTDVRVEVEATKDGGPDDNSLGLICRSQGPQDFYFALISSDGFAGIGKTNSGQQTLLTGDNLAPADAIHRGNSKNTIRLDCLGNSLSLLVNGTQVATVTDSDFAEGDVGLMAGTYDTPGTDIQFDNFVVRAP